MYKPIALPVTQQSAATAVRSERYNGLIVAASLLLMIITAAIISRLLYINQSLRLDEAQSLWQTSHGVGRMLQLVAQDVHVPLYHLLLHFWQVFFGNGVATVRYLSLLIFAAVIPLSYVLARQLFGWRESLVAAALITISPFMNWYGNEARMYLLLTMFTIINQIFFIRIMQRKAGAWWGYTLSAMLGIYSHYFFAFVLLTQAVFFLLNRRAFPKGSFARLVGVAVAVAAAISPWLYYVFSLGSANSTKPHLIKPSSVDLFNTFSQFFFGFQNDRINTLIVSLWPIIILMGFLAVQKNRRFTPVITYLGLAVLVPIGAAFSVSLLVTPLYISRYLIVALPALYLMLIWMITSLSSRLRGFILTILIAAMTLTLGHQAASADTPVKEDYQEAAAYISGHAQPQDVVVISAPFTVYPLEYYYNGSAPLVTLPQWNRFEAGDAPQFVSANLAAEVKNITDQHRNAWLILSYDQGHNSEILHYYEMHFERLDKKELSPGLTIYGFKLRYDVVNTPALLDRLNR